MEAHELVMDLKKRVLAGEEVKAEDYARIIDSLRTDRSAGASKPKTRAGKPKEVAQKVDLLSAIVPAKSD